MADIDSTADRMCIRVVSGKGANDRYVPLAPDALALLRQWWRQSRQAFWLFSVAHDASRPLDKKSSQRWYCMARAQAGTTGQGGIHSLRHA